MRSEAEKARRLRYNMKRYGLTAEKSRIGGRRLWQDWEIKRLMARDVTDWELAKELGRPERGIQIKRCRVRRQQRGLPEQ